MLRYSDLTLENAIDICHAAEAKHNQMKTLKIEASGGTSVHGHERVTCQPYIQLARNLDQLIKFL